MKLALDHEDVVDGPALARLVCRHYLMNVKRLKQRFPGRALKRIDLSIGVKDLWGRGIGSRVIRLLTRFGLDRLGADAIFAVGIDDFNARSLGGINVQ